MSDTSTLTMPARPLRILVAENYAVSRRFAVSTLAKAGHTATLANDGREAVEVPEKEPFDLVLTDVEMPQMNGREATAAIRERARSDGT